MKRKLQSFPDRTIEYNFRWWTLAIHGEFWESLEKALPFLVLKCYNYNDVSNVCRLWLWIGLSNAAKAKTRTRALLWILIFTVFGLLTSQALVSTIEDYLAYPIITTTDVTYHPEVSLTFDSSFHHSSTATNLDWRLSSLQWPSAIWTGSTVTMLLLPWTTWGLPWTTQISHRMKRLCYTF